MPTTKSFSGKKLLGAITALMDRMEAKYRSAFLKFVEDITNNSDLTEIIRDIRSGAITTVDAPVLQRIQGIRLNTYDLTNASRQAFASGGKVTASTVGFEGRFNLQNPKAIEMARTLSDQLSDTLSRTVQENLIDIIQDAVAGMDSPQETVRRIQQEIGLSKQHAQAVKNYRRNLIQTGMDKIRAGKRAEQYAKRLLKYRAETIARTEVAIAVNKGQQVFWNQMKDEGAIPPNTQKVWIAEMDAKTCDICYPLNGMLAPVDGSWMTANGPYDIAHAHPRCRCTSGLVFPSKVKKDDPLGYEMWLLEKGDYPGHPFRGNQWTRGTGGGRRSASDLRGRVDGGGSAKRSAEPLSTEEFLALSKAIRSNLHSNLNRDELHGIDQYFGDNYRGVNNILRRGRIEDSRYDDYMVEYAKHMESAFEKAAVALPRDTVVYRGMQIFPNDSFKFEVGSVVTDKAYSSTSAEHLGAMKFARVMDIKPKGYPRRQVILKINVPKGTKVLTSTGDIGTYGGESEILLNKGAKFKVVSVEKIKGVKASPQSERINSHELVTVELVP